MILREHRTSVCANHAVGNREAESRAARETVASVVYTEKGREDRPQCGMRMIAEEVSAAGASEISTSVPSAV